MKIIFIADYFTNQVLGGGELNNEELIRILHSKNHQIEQINSPLVTPAFIEANKDSHFIVANFVNLPQATLHALYDKKYLIYEHDHKYLITRDPSVYENYKAPPEAIINKEFYHNARAVLCQSRFHLEIVYKNLKINNLINLSGNLWSNHSLDLIEKLSQVPKNHTCAILNSNIPHKNTREAVMYCEHTKKAFNLIASKNYADFLKQMSTNDTFVFFPKTPETLSRVIVEARMMGLSVVTNKSVGATREEWYQLKGIDLINKVREMRTNIPETVLRAFE
mgnify:CR=1 FL=1|tara:strand:+ start:5090 stop:5926 length:837 start_codon:yes stop_codon:yes gene_type:complete